MTQTLWTQALWTQTPSPTGTGQPQDRSTEFVADSGGTDTTSAPLILVSAYIAMWALLLWFVWLGWRRQSRLSAQVADLERVLTSGGAAKPR